MSVGAVGSSPERRPRVKELFDPKRVDAALDLLHSADMAWHDCYGPRELEVPPRVLDDILLLDEGDLATLIRVAQAVIDFRDAVWPPTTSPPRGPSNPDHWAQRAPGLRQVGAFDVWARFAQKLHPEATIADDDERRR